MMEPQPKFFTWIEERFDAPEQVPMPMRAFMQIMWLSGHSIEELAKMFHVEPEWVDEFVRASYGKPPQLH